MNTSQYRTRKIFLPKLSNKNMKPYRHNCDIAKTMMTVFKLFIVFKKSRFNTLNAPIKYRHNKIHEMIKRVITRFFAFLYMI